MEEPDQLIDNPYRPGYYDNINGAEILYNFLGKITSESKDIEQDIIEVVNDIYWDLL